MPSKNINNAHWDALLPVLEEHAAWFHKVIQCLFYAELDDVSCTITKPTSFAQWFVQANRQDGGVQAEVVEKLSALHADLLKISDTLIYSAQEIREKPSYKSFKKFLTVYEEFSLYVRRLEKDMMMEEGGYDLSTGLRSRKMLAKDFAREMDRLARQGKSFCVSMARIDNFDVLKKQLGHDEVDGYIKLIAGLIKLSIRSFDDAYYMGGNEFILCLKQADVSGGIAALERLRKELERQSISVETNNSTLPLSLSCCIAEPVEGDKIKELIKNLRTDLGKNATMQRTDSVLQYHELSPLQRYIQQGDHVQ